MYLSEVVINGFKSFADRTRIDLRPGITAIVGPNGCGKSNIVDAIRWVLGEQSPKALRGGNMQDVIFSGTDKRKALPLCEVELVFSDCEQQLGTAFNEVAISRRVMREGGSDYFLNGKPCRLKDVQRLFMDTGVGRASYSFMMQGQIDDLLKANPAERRVLFEEAAGITRYKTQRREALGKLALVDQNLARITDVIEEVSRQIATLKRQAAKALRFKRLKHRLTHLDLAHQSFQYTRRRGVIIEQEQLAGELRERVATLQGALRGREERVAAAKQERAQVYERLQENQQLAFNLRSEKESAESQAEFADTRAGDLRERAKQVSAELDALEARGAELEARLAGQNETKQAHAGEFETSDETLRIRQRDLDEVNSRTAGAESALRQERQDLLMSEGEITRHRSTVTTIEVDLKNYQSRHGDFTNALAELREQRLAIEARLAEATAVADARRAEVATARADADAAAEAGKRLTAEFRQTQQQIQAADRDVARMQAQLNVLEQVHAKFEGFSEGAKAILKGDLADAVPAGAARPITDLVKITNPDDAALFENLLGTASSAVVVDTAVNIPALVAALDERNLGRAAMLAATGNTTAGAGSATAPAFTPDPAAEAISLRPAAAVIPPRAPEHAPRLADLLERCYFCDTLAGFLDYWRAHPAFDFLLVATTGGELVDRRGLIYGGKRARGKKETSIFQRENEIAQLRQNLTAANDHLTELNVAAMRLQQELDENETAVEDHRRRIATLNEELQGVVAEERATKQTLAGNDDALARQQAQISELEAGKKQAEDRAEKARAGLAAKEQEIEQRRATIARLEQEIETHRADADAARDALNEVRLERATKQQQLQMLDAALASIRAELTENQTRRDARLAELETTDAQADEHQQTAKHARARALQIAETLVAAQQTLETDRLKHTELEREIEAADISLRDEREDLRENETKLKTCEVRLTEETSQCGFLSEKVLTDYQLDITTLDWKNQLWLADEEFETKVNLDELDDEDEAATGTTGAAGAATDETTAGEETAAAATAPEAESSSRAAGVHAGAPRSPSRRRRRPPRGEPTPADLAALENTDWPPLVREITDLRDRINSMGALNLAAIEEYAELRERYTFLKTQSDDLWNSKNELTKAIDEINQTSQQLFNDTFAQIRKNFIFTFERLFNGGSADLQLIAAEDPLDSGIEIKARPPGTKLNGLSLLSGGQRTMTAVAILFAIYMVKPSPFCVLDELDAALDDANVGRFTDIVREFTRYSQFLVVTHNKRTVSAADTIYGVTMQERGVTKLLSMRFNKETGKTEEVAAGAAPAGTAGANSTAGNNSTGTAAPALPGAKPAFTMAR